MDRKETEKNGLPPAAKRALAEAQARKQAAANAAKAQAAEKGAGAAAAKEIGGRREGREPTRFGDWEFKGRAIDF